VSVAFAKFFAVKDLRKRLFFTLLVVFIARIGANIPIPGVDPLPLRNFFADRSAAANGGGLVGLYNMFTGGAFLKGAVFGLGIMPYISASIIMQLLGAAMPSLARLQQEGDSGRQRIAQYTRYLTLAVCLVQGLLLAAALARYPCKLFPGFDVGEHGSIVIASSGLFFAIAPVFLTAGTMILVWLGDQISRSGIGSGISVLIVVGILSSMPRSFCQVFGILRGSGGGSSTTVGLRVAIFMMMVVLLLAVILSMVAVTQGQRKIPVQYAKRMVGNRLYSGGGAFLPLKVNYSGVMPIIFANALLLFPQQIFAYLCAATGVKFFQSVAFHLSQGSAVYYGLYGLLIFAFSYLWVSLMFHPTQVADELKKNGGYVPSIRPGAPTAQFLDFIMTRLTFAGAIFLMLTALMPDFLYFSFHVPYGVAILFGGTGTLITVGVLLEMMRQIEAYLVQKNYDVFLKKGSRAPRGLSVLDGAGKRDSRFLVVAVAAALAVGTLAALFRVLWRLWR
jgi:preprotein translocase subunit SecY